MRKRRDDLILIFDRFKGFSVKDIYEHLPANRRPTLKCLYNYHLYYKRADREEREETRNWL